MKEKKSRKNIDNIAEQFIAHLKLSDHKKRDDEGEMWQRIIGGIAEEEKKSRMRKRMYRFYISVSAVAACVLLFLYVSKDNIDTGDSLENYVNQLAEVPVSNGQVQLLLSGDKIVSVDKDSVGIVYTSNGGIQINEETTEVEEEDAKEIQFNQVVVPKGKYTQLTLADGTRMHVNSGSRVVYPRVFNGDRREIYVDGEVYLDVTPDKNKPFHVKTSQFEVEVLGTSFNVNAYKKNAQCEVVLVEGSVKLCDRFNREVLLEPNNLITVCDGQSGMIRHVNARDYTAWIDGLLILHAEPLMSVFEKLDRFYDTPIVVAPAIQMEIVDGKLDLHLPLPELIQMISGVVPIDYQLNDGVYYISPK